jgi:hypothetical protein
VNSALSGQILVPFCVDTFETTLVTLWVCCVCLQRKEFYQSQRAIIRKKIDSEAVSLSFLYLVNCCFFDTPCAQWVVQCYSLTP